MKNKYYIPKVKEFYPGFEYERKETSGKLLKKEDIVIEWKPQVFSIKELLTYSFEPEDNYFKTHLKQNMFRVKYLDKEDIESLGFKESKTDINWYDYKNDRYWLYKEDTKDWRSIISDQQSEISFAGAIKNKSELKVLLKQLNINE